MQLSCAPLQRQCCASDFARANEDVAAIGRLFRYCKLRKSPPHWSFPAGVWRMLFYPGLFRARKKAGVGASPPAVVAPCAQRCIHWLLASIRARCCTPLVWHATSAFTIGKHNGKSGCQGQHLLHGLDSFSKNFFLHVRLDLAGCGRCTDFFDAANAFASPSHPSLLQFVERSSPSEWISQILCQRLADATLFLPCVDGQLVLGIGSGTLPGDSIACEWFLGVYHQAVDAFVVQHFGPPLQVHCPWLGNVLTDGGPRAQQALLAQARLPFDVSLSAYADDLARTRLVVDIPQFVATGNAQSDALSAASRPASVVQNTDKHETLLKFAGRGARQGMRAAYGLALPVPGTVVRLARYLGSRLQYNGTLGAEQGCRLQAAKAAYAILGGFWGSTRNTRWKGLVFNSMVLGALTTGLRAFVLPKGMEAALDSQAAILARKAVQGRACDRSHPGHFKALTNTATLRMLQCAPPSTTLQVHRLRLWQQLVARPERTVCLLGCMFGSMFTAYGHMVSTKHKFVEQLRSDMQALSSLTPLDSFIGDILPNPLVLFTDAAARDAFLRADPAVLLAAQYSVAIPPPGFAPLAALDTAPERPHVCRIVDPSTEQECGASFGTYQALVLHQVRASRPGHGKRKLAYVLTVSNQELFLPAVGLLPSILPTPSKRVFARLNQVVLWCGSTCADRLTSVLSASWTLTTSFWPKITYSDISPEGRHGHRLPTALWLLGAAFSRPGPRGR